MALTEQQLAEVFQHEAEMAQRIAELEAERDEAVRVAATLRASRAEIRTKLNEAVQAYGAELAEARGEIGGLHETIAAAEQVVTEMAGMVGGPPVRHYASRLRATLGLHDPNPCRCYACKQAGGEPDA